MREIIYEAETDRKNHLLFMRRNIMDTRLSSGRMFFHGSVELLFGLKGKSDVFIDGERYDLTEGRIIFLKPFQHHNFSYLSGSMFYVVVISSDFFDGVNNLKHLVFPTVMERTESFERIKALLDTCYSVRNTDSMAFKSGFVNLLISVMCENYPHSFESEQGGIYNTLIDILDYINNNFQSDLTVSGIAKKFGYSSNYFSTLFNKHMKMSFREYLNRRRISEYTALRKSSPELPSYKAAEISGFRNLSSFYDTVNKMKADSNVIDYEF